MLKDPASVGTDVRWHGAARDPATACIRTEIRGKCRFKHRVRSSGRRLVRTVKKQADSITSLPPSPDDERNSRMLKYSIAMGIRVICIVAMLFLHGWWLVIPAIGAIVLPYFAMILANVGSPGESGNVERPGGLELAHPRPFAPAPPAPPADEGSPDVGSDTTGVGEPDGRS